MPTYSITDLANIAGVSARTVRYYIGLGLLPSAGFAGPATRYDDTHLARLRLIRQLQKEHRPLAEIRRQLAGMDDSQVAQVAALTSLTTEVPTEPASALDYVRRVLGQDARSPAARSPAALPLRPPAAMAAPAPPMPETTRWMASSLARRAPDWVEPVLQAAASPLEPPMSAPEPPKSAPQAPSSAPARSQWDRIPLDPDIELHVRRPLSRAQNRRVERLIALAQQLFEEE